MSFELYAGQCRRGPLARGRCRLYRDGSLLIPRADLAAAAIGERASILTDAPLRRVGLRAPRDGDHSAIVSRAKGEHNGRVCIRGALRHMGLTLAELLGEYAMDVRRDGLITINLDIPVARVWPAPAQRPAKRPAKASTA